MQAKDVPLAVVPAAGLGTRLAPATWNLPKELMPVGPYPMIQWALEEIVEAGLTRAAIVVSPAKPALAEFLARWRRGRALRMSMVEQPRPVGIADALMRVRHLTDAAPFALLFPDNVFFPSGKARGALAQVLEAFSNVRADVSGLIRVEGPHAARYSHAGLVDLHSHRGSIASIERLHGKRKGPLRVPTGKRAHKTFARAVLLPHFFKYLEQTARARPKADEVPALQAVLRHHGLHGVFLRGRGFDAGNPEGYAAAIEFWARRVCRRGTLRR